MILRQTTLQNYSDKTELTISYCYCYSHYQYMYTLYVQNLIKIRQVIVMWLDERFRIRPFPWNFGVLRQFTKYDENRRIITAAVLKVFTWWYSFFFFFKQLWKGLSTRNVNSYKCSQRFVSCVLSDLNKLRYIVHYTLRKSLRYKILSHFLVSSRFRRIHFLHSVDLMPIL